MPPLRGSPPSHAWPATTIPSLRDSPNPCRPRAFRPKLCSTLAICIFHQRTRLGIISQFIRKYGKFLMDSFSPQRHKVPRDFVLFVYLGLTDKTRQVLFPCATAHSSKKFRERLENRQKAQQIYGPCLNCLGVCVHQNNKKRPNGETSAGAKMRKIRPNQQKTLPPRPIGARKTKPPLAREPEAAVLF